MDEADRATVLALNFLIDGKIPRSLSGGYRCSTVHWHSEFHRQSEFIGSWKFINSGVYYHLWTPEWSFFNSRMDFFQLPNGVLSTPGWSFINSRMEFHQLPNGVFLTSEWSSINFRTKFYQLAKINPLFWFHSTLIYRGTRTYRKINFLEFQIRYFSTRNTFNPFFSPKNLPNSLNFRTKFFQFCVISR